MAEDVNRRNFLKAAALAAGPAIISARAANDKINIGWIGVGTRGYAGLDWLHTAAANDVKITAICDTYQGYIARASSDIQYTHARCQRHFIKEVARHLRNEPALPHEPPMLRVR